jgi:hypothetical protein
MDDSAAPVQKSLATDLLQYGLRLSSASGPFPSCRFWFDIPFAKFPDPFAGLSDATAAALSRSEVEFSELIQRRHTTDSSHRKETAELYRLVTSMG